MTKTKSALSRSIKRTLEVLEYFDPEHTTVSVTEISRELGYPQSSTSILLKSLRELGYLHYDKANRSYRPTARVALLGRGVQAHLFGDGSVMSAMEEIAQQSGEMVILAVQEGIVVRYVYVIPATNPMRMHLRPGAVRPMVGSAVGHLFLSALPEPELADEITRLHRVQAEFLVDEAKLMLEIKRIRRLGHSLSTHTVTPGGGIVAILLSGEFNGSRIAIGIGGVAETISSNEKRFVEIMQAAVQRHIRLPNTD
ncbi:MAG: DNA-binding IclR family transcriptional regulator [Gammaproteobacteria bacterium]|jgi:DNA-binding IclR family transcriptional regulator